MDLTTPARELSDPDLDARIAYLDLRRAVQPLPTLDYASHTAECAPDDDDGPAQDWRSMNALVLAFCLCWVAMSAIALALVML